MINCNIYNQGERQENSMNDIIDNIPCGWEIKIANCNHRKICSIYHQPNISGARFEIREDLDLSTQILEKIKEVERTLSDQSEIYLVWSDKL